MKLGLSTLYLQLSSTPFEKLFEEVRRLSLEEGVLLWELVDDGVHELDEERVLKLRRLRELGVEFQVHGPYGTGYNIADPEPERRLKTLGRFLSSLKAAAELEARVWVVHPGVIPEGRVEEAEECAVLSLLSLTDEASSLGVRVGVENMPPLPGLWMTKPEEFRRLEARCGAKLGLTLDVGHANLAGTLEVFFKTLGDRVVNLHCHDNDGVEDGHLEVGAGRVDWAGISRSLRAVAEKACVVVESVENPLQSLRRLRGILHYY